MKSFGGLLVGTALCMGFTFSEASATEKGKGLKAWEGDSKVTSERIHSSSNHFTIKGKLQSKSEFVKVESFKEEADKLWSTAKVKTREGDKDKKDNEAASAVEFGEKFAAKNTKGWKQKEKVAAKLGKESLKDAG